MNSTKSKSTGLTASRWLAFGEDTKKDHTVIWLNTFGKARVFGTSLGHHNETMNNEVWLNLVARGLLWSVDKLEPNGKPASGYEGSGTKPIVIEPKQAAIPVPDPAFAVTGPPIRQIDK